MKISKFRISIFVITTILFFGLLASLSILSDSNAKLTPVSNENPKLTEAREVAETNNPPTVNGANILYGEGAYFSEWYHVDLGMDQRYPVGQDGIPLFWLTAHGSDPDGDPITYHWSIVTKPVDSAAELDDSWVPWRLYPDVPGYYLVSVVVSDGELWSNPDYVSMHVYEENYVTNYGGRIDEYDTDNNGEDDVWVTPRWVSGISTNVEVSTIAPAPASGFLATGHYYDISATEGFENAKVSIKYDDSTFTLEQEENLRLYNYKEVSQGVWDWVDVTIGSVDWINNVIAGESSSLSWFTLGYTAPIFIDDDTDFETYGFPGSGTESNPYIVEGFNLSTSTSTLIHIQDTTAHFIVRNCILDGIDGSIEGIYLNDVQNGNISENRIINCWIGIDLYGIQDCYFIDNEVVGKLYYYGSNYGIDMSLSDNCVFAFNEVHQFVNGFKISSSSFNSFYHNTVNISYTQGMRDYTGFWLSYSDNNIFSNNTVTADIASECFVFLIESSNDNLFTTNTISCKIDIYVYELPHTCYGFYLSTGNRNNIGSNNISIGFQYFLQNEPNYGYGYGIHLISTQNCSIMNNDIRIFKFAGNGATVGYNIHLQNCWNSTISHNNITSGGEGTGIYLYDSSNTTIVANYVYQNFECITLADSPYNLIFHNMFIDNYQHPFISGNSFGNQWYHPILLEGNFWSDYVGFDDGSGVGKHAIAGDGIGDTDLPWPGFLGSDNYPLVYDTDLDGLTDTQELVLFGTDVNNPDTDFDLLPDGWEVQNGLDPLVMDSDQDLDSDGLTNIQEYQIGTEANDFDTDNDLMPDGWEYYIGLDPFSNDAEEDPDGDNLSNLAEYEANPLYSTNPFDSDTDHDSMPDDWELEYNLMAIRPS